MTQTFIPFQKRAWRDCVQAWALTKEGEIVQIENWIKTHYWGERQFEVRVDKKFSIKINETDLEPINLENIANVLARQESIKTQILLKKQLDNPTFSKSRQRL